MRPVFMKRQMPRTLSVRQTHHGMQVQLLIIEKNLIQPEINHTEILSVRCETGKMGMR